MVAKRGEGGDFIYREWEREIGLGTDGFVEGKLGFVFAEINSIRARFCVELKGIKSRETEENQFNKRLRESSESGGGNGSVSAAARALSGAGRRQCSWREKV